MQYIAYRDGCPLIWCPKLLDGWRRRGLCIGFTNGCFSVIHAGHTQMIERATKQCDRLILAINSAQSVVRLKGKRPVISDALRGRMLSVLPGVEVVLIQDSMTPCELLRAIKPDVLFKGGTTDEIVGREIVELYGGKAVKLPTFESLSSTEILDANSRAG